MLLVTRGHRRADGRSTRAGARGVRVGARHEPAIRRARTARSARSRPRKDELEESLAHWRRAVALDPDECEKLLAVGLSLARPDASTRPSVSCSSSPTRRRQALRRRTWPAPATGSTPNGGKMAVVRIAILTRVVCACAHRRACRRCGRSAQIAGRALAAPEPVRRARGEQPSRSASGRSPRATTGDALMHGWMIARRAARRRRASSRTRGTRSSARPRPRSRTATRCSRSRSSSCSWATPRRPSRF